MTLIPILAPKYNMYIILEPIIAWAIEVGESPKKRTLYHKEAITAGIRTEDPAAIYDKETDTWSFPYDKYGEGMEDLKLALQERIDDEKEESNHETR